MKNNRMMKILAVALALMLMGAALAEVRTTASVWMRGEPNLQGEQITSFSENTALEYLGATSVDERGVAWYKVTNGKFTGWVSSRYSELLNEESVIVDEGEPAGDGEPEQQGNWFLNSADGEELSAYYGEGLMQAATALGLTDFRSVENSEVPFQYYNDAVTIAGNDAVEYIGVTGAGYTVYGAAVGMAAGDARALLAAAGMDAVDDAGVAFGHPAGESAGYADENGHDSCISLELSDGVVAAIDWSTYTG